jgi:hypothetical protein
MLLITLLKAACLEVMVSEMLLDYTVYIYTCMVRVSIISKQTAFNKVINNVLLTIISKQAAFNNVI